MRCQYRHIASFAHLDSEFHLHLYHPQKKVHPRTGLVRQNYFQDNHKIIVGITRNKETEIFNSMALIDNNLRLISVYDKNKLVPFG